jgi:HK97 family phage major capsid protein
MNSKEARRAFTGAQNPLLRAIHLGEPPASGLEVLNEQISSDDSPPEFNRKRGKLYAVVGDLIRHKDATLAEISKIAPEVAKFAKVAEKAEDARLKAEQALELARAADGTVPGSGNMANASVQFVRSVARGYVPDDEFCKLARVNNIDGTYFNLISRGGRSIKALGAPMEVESLLARFRLVNDSIFMLNKLYSIRDQGTYTQLGGMKGLGLWKEWEELCKRVMLASDLAEGAATTGGAWVPTIWSGNLMQLVQLLSRFPNYFESFPMQSQTQKGFVEGADTTPYFIAEGASITLGDFTTFDATWVAKKMAARIVTSRELSQDAAVPMTQEIERKLAKSLSRGTEDVLVNSQTTGTTPGGAGSLDSGQTIAAGDVRLLANGIRYWHAQTGLGVKDAGAGLTIEGCAKLRGPMGPYGVDPSQMLWLCSAWGSAHILTIRTEDGRPVFIGPERDAPPGTIGTLLGSDIVLSSYVNDDYNSAGVRDGAGATTAIYYPNVDQFKIGDRLGIIVEASTHDKFETDQIVFKAVRRFDFQPVRTPSGAEPMVNAIGNLGLS